MSKIISQYLQIFQEPIIDDSMTEFEYVEYVTRDSDINKDGQRILETQDLDQYLLPHKSYLEVRGRLKKDDGSNYAATDQITLVNNGWSLFQSAQYQINNQTIEDINMYLPQASTILNLAMFSDDYARSTSTNMLWYKDTGTGVANSVEFSVLTTAGDIPTRNSTFNSGFAARQKITTGDKEICMFLPLSSIFGFCRDIQTVFRGTKHTLILNRQTANNYIFRTGSTSGKFTINALSWWIPKVIPSIAVQTDIERKMVTGHTKQMYFEQMRIYRSTAYLAAQVKATWRITTNQGSELPRHLFIAFQLSTRDNSQTQNNMVFDHLNLTRIQARINSKPYPSRELETNFNATGRNYARVYFHFQEAMNKYQDTDSGSQLSVEEFVNLYPIIHIDVSKHSERLKDSPADIELTWTLGSEPAQPYHVYALITSDRYISLNIINGKMNIII